MKVKDLKDRGTVDEIVLKISGKEEPRAVRGGQLQVCNMTGEDDTGKVIVALWNDEIGQVNDGDQIKITKGWSAVYNNQMQVSRGKFGTLEVVK